MADILRTDEQERAKPDGSANPLLSRTPAGTIGVFDAWGWIAKLIRSGKSMVRPGAFREEPSVYRQSTTTVPDLPRFPALGGDRLEMDDHTGRISEFFRHEAMGARFTTS